MFELFQLKNMCFSNPNEQFHKFVFETFPKSLIFVWLENCNILSASEENSGMLTWFHSCCLWLKLDWLDPFTWQSQYPLKDTRPWFTHSLKYEFSPKKWYIKMFTASSQLELEKLYNSYSYLRCPLQYSKVLWADNREKVVCSWSECYWGSSEQY